MVSVPEVMVPDLDLTLPMNGGSKSTIPSTIIDESASTGTNLSFAPSSAKPNPLPFNNHCPVQISIIGGFWHVFGCLEGFI